MGHSAMTKLKCRIKPKVKAGGYKTRPCSSYALIGAIL
jgi:hypothetical protein